MKQFIFIILALGLVLTGCDQKKDNNKNNGVHTYGFQQNGQCYDYTAQVLVSQNYCTNTGTNGYTYNAQGICVSSTTGAAADQSYCANNGYNNGINNGYTLMNGVCYSANGQQYPLNYCSNTGANGQQQCYGEYMQYTNGTWIRGTCNGANCRGATLYTLAGQQVTCY